MSVIDLEPYENEPAEIEVTEAVIEAVSPHVDTEPIEDGTRVIITDVDGEHSFDVLNGEKGEQGDPGYTPQKGVDYWTPAEAAEVEAAVLAANDAASLVELDIPILMSSGTYVNSNYNGIRTSDRTVTIDGTEYAYYWWSGWIDVRGLDKLRFRTVLGGGAGYAFRRGDIITTYSGDNLVLKTYIVDIPHDAEYFAFSAVLYNQTKALAEELENNEYHEFSLKGASTGAFLNRQADNILRAAQNAYPPYEELLPAKKVLCFGDSLTVGALPSGSGYGSATTPYSAWMEAIGTFPGKVEKIAKSGYSAGDWYADPDYANISWSDYGTILLWLGTNDGPTNVPAARYADETQGTQTYYYRAIIEDIKRKNANARIILGAVFKSTNNVQIVNAIIRMIANLYPDNVLGVANLDDGTLYGPEETELHGDYETNPHFSAGGYFVLGVKWLGEVRRLIHSNISKFTDTVTPRPSSSGINISTETISGGTRVTITDGEGDHVFDVMDGATGPQGPQGESIVGPKGDKGDAGSAGADGYSPTASVSKSGGTATITITDKTGTTTATISDGATGPQGPKGDKGDTGTGEKGEKGDPGSAGADGYSPTATISKSGTTATITITDKNGTTSATISDGQNGEKGDPGDDYVLTAQDKADIAGMVAIPVTDVQVNGTSVVSSGTANIPTATTAQVKAGTATQRPLTPGHQHEAAFYGLAKAAGDTTQASSDNAVGAYTETAQSKISEMLDKPIAVSGTTPSITGKAGIRYVCGEVSTISITPPASGSCEVRFTSGTTAAVLTAAGVVWPDWFDATALEASRVYDLIITDGVYGVVMSWPV